MITAKQLAARIPTELLPKIKSCDALLTAVSQLKIERNNAIADSKRLDWLADPANTIGNVLLPNDCVEQNLLSLRDAIDAAMATNPEQALKDLSA